MDAYITGSGPAAIIVIYDIFGFKFNQVSSCASQSALRNFFLRAIP